MNRPRYDWDAQPLGQVLDSHIAAQLGCTTAAVTQQRKRRGIAPYAGPNMRGRCLGSGKDRAKTPTLSKPAPEPIAARPPVETPAQPTRPQWPSQSSPRREVAPIPSNCPRLPPPPTTTRPNDSDGFAGTVTVIAEAQLLERMNANIARLSAGMPTSWQKEWRRGQRAST